MLPIATPASKQRPLRGRKRGSRRSRQPTIAFLSYSTGEYDARTFRMAESALDAGYRVRVYSRWHPGQLPREDRGDYELVRVPFDWRLGLPFLRKAARRRAAGAMAAAPTQAALAAAAVAEASADDDSGPITRPKRRSEMSPEEYEAYLLAKQRAAEAAKLEKAWAAQAAKIERAEAAEAARQERAKRAAEARAKRSPLEQRVRRLLRPLAQRIRRLVVRPIRRWVVGPVRRRLVRPPIRAARRLGRRVVRFGKQLRRYPRQVLAIPGRIRARLRPFGHLWRQLVMFPLGPRGWAVALESVAEPADIWHGMWAGSLPALARMRKRHGGRTIYDSRDIFMESRDWARLNGPVRAVLQRLERRWAQRADLVITVNESYARILEQLLEVPRPPVVMNCQPRWTQPDPPPDLIRQALGLKPDVGIALYQGRLQSDRGIEQSMDAILEVPNAVLVLLGFGSWQRRLAQQITAPPYAGRVHLLPAVPPDRLVDWTASADVAVMAIQPSSLNHRWTTPQKLFESLAAGTPVVASDLPGMAEIVAPSKTGLLADPTDPHDIAEKIRAIIDAPQAERQALRIRVTEAAREQFTWEAQVVTLLKLYRQLLGDDRAAFLRPRLRRTSGPTLHLVNTVGEALSGDVQLVLDPGWVPPASEPHDEVLSALTIGDDILRARDVGRDAMELLDRWTERADIPVRTALHGTSFWYGLRLQFWSWVLHTSLWLAVLRRVLDEHPQLVRLSCPSDADEQLIEACELVADARGLTFDLAPPANSVTELPDARRARPDVAGPPETRFGRLRWRLLPPAVARRQEEMQARLLRLEREAQGRLLVVGAHVPQRINTPQGPRLMNAYLGPIVERLQDSPLQPIELDLRADLANDEHWERLNGPRADRTLSGYVLTLAEVGYSASSASALSNRLAAEIAADPTPLVVDGVDLGPPLRRAVSQRVKSGLPRRVREIAEIRALLRRLRPAGILIADEYHRQDWLAAAALEAVPVAAVQHGVIHDTHVGYVHRTRTPELRLPDRTYVFGSWERSLLLRDSVYRADEVIVGGSPRLDLVHPEPANAAGLRRQLGVAPGRRMLVLSGSWGPLQRRFYYPIALRHLFDRELNGVHIVVKLHPTESDEGPYRQVIEAAAARGGFEPPPITTVQDIDLYDLLAAADAHIGVRSTVLTEAVVVGTPNLLAAGLAGYDQLEYVKSGVAVPVHDGGEMGAALSNGALSIDEEARRAFVVAHFDPQGGAKRIAEDLEAWLGPTTDVEPR